MSGKIPKRIQMTRKFKNYGGGNNKAGIPSSIGHHPLLCKLMARRAYRSKINKPIQPKKHYSLTKFNSILKNELTPNQTSLVSYFEQFPFINKVEEYSYNDNTEYTIINIRQHHFTDGTLRIKKPGIYVLQEDIEFNPNPTYDSLPISSQSQLYPSTGHSPYRLGFFAAITIECDNVILDLKNHTIQQSKLHFLQQRFYANIEIASAPFIGPQGPGIALGENDYRSGNTVLIMNGTLGLSSHHGIHSNFNNGVVLHNLTVTNFQVGGIALNGLTNGIFNNIIVKDSNKETPVLFSFSQARFIREFLDMVPLNESLNVKGTNKPVSDIVDALIDELDDTKDEYLSNATITSDLFRNVSSTGEHYGDSDGNIYGIVLNVTGVVVNDFLTERPADGTIFGDKNPNNNEIHLQNVTIQNVSSEPRETVAIDVSGNESLSGYTKNNHLVKGPVGDVFDASFNVNPDGSYKSNVLADAQALLGKYKLLNSSASLGTSYIKQSILDWIASNPGTNITFLILLIMMTLIYYHMNTEKMVWRIL